MELPKLTGSVKQIEWANKIRENSFAKFQEFAQTKAKDAPTGKTEAFVKSIFQFLEVIASEKIQASWWIKWRSENGAKIYNLITPDFFWSHRKEFRSEWQQILVNNGLLK